MPRLSLVIPCYNEAGNLPPLIRKIRDTFDGDVEVILVDNGSTDATPQLMQNLLPEGSAVRSVRVPVNQGYGHGILQGLAASTGDVLAWTHADMQTDPCDVLRAFELYSKHTAEKIVVKGKRQKRPLLDMVFTTGMQLIASAKLGVWLDDINAQPKLFSRSFYEAHVKDKAPHDFSLDLFLLYAARKNGFKILTVPVIFSERFAGKAKGGGASLKTRLKISARTLNYIFRGF